MDFGFCPRCGVKRPDAFQWCWKCGLDFQNPPKPDVAASVPPLEVDASTRVDVRPVNDRRNMAQWTRDALTVRCLGTIGGVLGAFIGFLLVGWLAAAMNLGVGGLLLALIGLPVGFFLGARFALGLLAR